jgi:hypothetical protein
MPLNPGQAPAHLPSLEDKKKGGAVVSPLKCVANSTRNRKYCSVKCLFAEECPMMPLSMSKEFEFRDKYGSIRHPCKLKDAPPGVQRRIRNMFLDGEKGLLHEITSTLFVAGTNLGADVKERLMYADALGKLYKTIYGETSMVRTSEPIEITVRNYSRPDGMSASEVKVLHQETAQKFLDRVKPITEEEVPTDPESLILSPMLNSILHREEEEEDMILYDIDKSEDNGNS